MALTAESGAWAFQFTRPRGARLFPQMEFNTNICFNSRAREGRDAEMMR